MIKVKPEHEPEDNEKKKPKPEPKHQSCLGCSNKKKINCHRKSKSLTSMALGS